MLKRKLAVFTFKISIKKYLLTLYAVWNDSETLNVRHSKTCQMLKVRCPFNHVMTWCCMKKKTFRGLSFTISYVPLIILPHDIVWQNKKHKIFTSIRSITINKSILLNYVEELPITKSHAPLIMFSHDISWQKNCYCFTSITPVNIKFETVVTQVVELPITEPNVFLVIWSHEVTLEKCYIFFFTRPTILKKMIGTK